MAPGKFPNTVQIMGCAIARLEINVLWVAWEDDGHPGMDVGTSVNGGLPNMESYRQCQCRMFPRL